MTTFKINIKEKDSKDERTNLGDVGHGSDQLVVVGQEVIIQALSIRVSAKKSLILIIVFKYYCWMGVPGNQINLQQ